MSLEITRKGHQDYAYFYPGRGGKIYLGNVTDVKNLQIKVDKVMESLDYVKERFSHYSEIEDRLISYLPPDKKDQYLSRRIEELYRMAEVHISSMSPSAARQFRSKVRKR